MRWGWKDWFHLLAFNSTNHVSLYGLCIFWSLIDETIDHVIVTLANNFFARSLTNFIPFSHITSVELVCFPCGDFGYKTFDFLRIFNLKNILNAFHDQHIFHINLSPSSWSKKQFIALWQSFSFAVTRQRKDVDVLFL